MSDAKSPYRVSQRPAAAVPRRCLSCGDAVNSVGYCGRCGTEASPSSLHGTEISPTCPRCSEALVAIAFGSGAVLRCPGCAGALVTPADWSELLEDREAERLVLAQMVPPVPGRAIPEAELAAFIRCPVCRHEMDRYRFAALTAIAVDACGEHGIWFDAKELAAVLQRIHAREEAARLGMVSPDDAAAEAEWAAHVRNVQRLMADKALENTVYRTPGLDDTFAFLVDSLTRR